MSPQWYWQHQGDLLGPLTTEELDHLIKQKRIGDRDQIRTADAEEWLTGETVKSMFGSSLPNGDQTPSQVASKVLLQPNLLSIKEQRPADQRLSLLASVFDHVRNLLGSVLECGAKGIVIAANYLSELRGQWVTFAALATIFGSLLIKDVDLAGSANHRIYKRFASAIELIKLKQTSNWSDSEWSELRKTLLPEITVAKEEILALSEKYPNGRPTVFGHEVENAEARGALTQVAYDLIRILNGDKNIDVKTFARVESEMRNVEKVFSGEFLTRFNMSRQSHLANGIARKGQSSWLFDSRTIVILTFDVLLGIGAAVYIIRRRFAAL